MKNFAAFLLIGVVTASAWATDEMDFSKPFTEAELMNISLGDQDTYSPPDFEKPFTVFRLQQIGEGDKDE